MFCIKKIYILYEKFINLTEYGKTVIFGLQTRIKSHHFETTALLKFLLEYLR